MLEGMNPATHPYQPLIPLLRNKPLLVEKAKEVFDVLKKDFMCEFDDNGNIGKAEIPAAAINIIKA